MNFEVFTYGGGEFLRLVFNGIAAIVGTGDYVTALKLAALVGVREFPMRVKCASLAWHTLDAAINGTEASVTTE